MRSSSGWRRPAGLVRVPEAATAAATVFAARRAPVNAPSAITYCYTYPGALHVAGEQQPPPLRTCCAHCCSPAAACTTAAATATAAYHHVYQHQPPQPLHQYQLAVAVTPQPKTPHVGGQLYHLPANNTYLPPLQQLQRPALQYAESVTTAPPTATIATPAADAVQQDDVEMVSVDWGETVMYYALLHVHVSSSFFFPLGLATENSPLSARPSLRRVCVWLADDNPYPFPANGFLYTLWEVLKSDSRNPETVPCTIQ